MSSTSSVSRNRVGSYLQTCRVTGASSAAVAPWLLNKMAVQSVWADELRTFDRRVGQLSTSSELTALPQSGLKYLDVYRHIVRDKSLNGLVRHDHISGGQYTAMASLSVFAFPLKYFMVQNHLSDVCAVGAILGASLSTGLFAYDKNAALAPRVIGEMDRRAYEGFDELIKADNLTPLDHRYLRHLYKVLYVPGYAKWVKGKISLDRMDGCRQRSGMEIGEDQDAELEIPEQHIRNLRLLDSDQRKDVQLGEKVLFSRDNPSLSWRLQYPVTTGILSVVSGVAAALFLDHTAFNLLEGRSLFGRSDQI